MAFQPVRWHKIHCLYYEGCLTIKCGEEVAALHDNKNVHKVFAHMSGVGACGCMRVVAVHHFLQKWHIFSDCTIIFFFFLSFWYLFHPLQRNIRAFWTVIYKAFIIVGSTMIKGELPTSARAFHFQRFDGSWSWIWCSTGVVCLPQVVNNNKAETNDEELVDPILCAHKVHIKYFPWDIHCYSLQNVDSCKNPGHSENFTLIV